MTNNTTISRPSRLNIHMLYSDRYSNTILSVLPFIVRYQVMHNLNSEHSSDKK